MAAETTPSLGYLSDVETKVDLLNNEAIARTVVRLVREKSEHPISIGVHGDWGAGKSSVLEMVETELSREESILSLKFNGWQFQGFEDAKIALIEGVILGLIEKRSLWSKATDEVKQILNAVDKLKLARKAGTLAFTALTGIPAFGFDELLGSAVEWVKSTVTDKDKCANALQEIADLKKDVGDDEKTKGRIEKGYSVPREITEFRNSFKKLIAKADIDRLVVLVDDLDRCLPSTAIETLEAIRLFLFLDKTAFIVGADEGMIEYAVRQHFPDLPETQTSQSYARAYLEKLLQVPFRIPALGETETHIYVTLLLVGGTLGDRASEFASLLKLGREALSKPWDTEVFTTEAVRASLKEKFEQVSELVLTADRISPVLSAGTKGNPRQIKRFLNALTLRLAVARERNFGDAIGQAHLAKIMLAELFLPDAVFSHIATTAANAKDGICPELAELEAFVDGGEKPTPDGAKSEETRPDGSDERSGAVVADWRLRPDVIRWARVKPPLGSTSLRPYLFVIKDRKNYVSGAAPLSQKLRKLVTKLAAGEIAAKSAGADVRELSPTEVSEVFKELRARVIASSSFDQKPDTFHGITVLVAEHPGLQGQYVELLNDLPTDSLGYWATTGHTIVKDPAARERLTGVLTRWSTSKNGLLKRAAANALNPPARVRKGS